MSAFKIKISTLFVVFHIAIAQSNVFSFQKNIFEKMPVEYLNAVKDSNLFKTQIIYTEILRDGNQSIVFQDHFWGDTSYAFYPASTVKLPTAIFVLEKLRTFYTPLESLLKIEENNCLIHKNYAPIFYRKKKEGLSDIAKLYDVSKDKIKLINQNTYKINCSRLESFDDILSKMLIYSNNAAFNKMYDFVGQLYYQKRLKELQINATIRNRLYICEDQSTTPAFSIFDSVTNKVLYKQSKEKNNVVYPENPQKNQIPIASLQEILKRLIFPETFADSLRYNLEKTDYEVLKEYIKMRPQDHTCFRDSEYITQSENMTNYLLVGFKNNISKNEVEIYNIVGRAYGYLIDCAYIKDKKYNKDFFLTCMIDTKDKNGNYGYEWGMPFFDYLGKAILNFERKK